jgi:hypothetical protein
MNPATELPLRDIHLPPAPSWWPPAPGWWLLALLLALAVWWLGRRLLRVLHQRRQREGLRAALRRIEQQHPLQREPVALLAAASELLRRATRQHAPAALSLQGEAWLGFLDRGLVGAPFTFGPGRLLLDGPFRPHLDPAEVGAALAVIEQRLLRLPTEADR